MEISPLLGRMVGSVGCFGKCHCGSRRGGAGEGGVKTLINGVQP